MTSTFYSLGTLSRAPISIRTAIEPIFRRVYRYFGSFSPASLTRRSCFMSSSYTLRIFTVFSNSISFGKSHDRFSLNASDQSLSDLGQPFGCHTLGCCPQLHAASIRKRSLLSIVTYRPLGLTFEELGNLKASALTGPPLSCASHSILQLLLIYRISLQILCGTALCPLLSGNISAPVLGIFSAERL
jgi:hypothetical protein